MTSREARDRRGLEPFPSRGLHGCDQDFRIPVEQQSRLLVKPTRDLDLKVIRLLIAVSLIGLIILVSAYMK